MCFRSSAGCNGRRRPTGGRFSLSLSTLKVSSSFSSSSRSTLSAASSHSKENAHQLCGRNHRSFCALAAAHVDKPSGLLITPRRFSASSEAPTLDDRPLACRENSAGLRARFSISVTAPLLFHYSRMSIPSRCALGGYKSTDSHLSFQRELTNILI